ncbi:MAG TPA: hypothetical protein VGT40_21710 [Methylomirabilota bacterium]|jgi:hypothetical protein|nr:hypothetical protein [Methylomirabilota bacterium]
MTGRLALALFPLALPFHPAAADVVELRGGERVEGTLREATPAGVLVEVAGQGIRFEVDKVRAIYFGSPGPRPTPPSPGTESAVGAAATSPASAALQLLHSLRSAVAGGTTLREYQARVNNTAPVVELYLAAVPPEPGDAIRDAMRYYVLAASAWSNQAAASRTVWLKRDDALARCAAYREFAQAMQSKGEAHYAERTRNYVVIGDGVISVLWSCAADKISEADTLVLKAKN